jgi:hypothetical protein
MMMNIDRIAAKPGLSCKALQGNNIANRLKPESVLMLAWFEFRQ